MNPQKLTPNHDGRIMVVGAHKSNEIFVLLYGGEVTSRNGNEPRASLQVSDETLSARFDEIVEVPNLEARANGLERRGQHDARQSQIRVGSDVPSGVFLAVPDAWVRTSLEEAMNARHHALLKGLATIRWARVQNQDVHRSRHIRPVDHRAHSSRLGLGDA